MRSLGVALLLGGLASSMPAAAENAAIKRVVDDFVRPGYAQFQQATATLSQDMRTLCDAPGETNLGKARMMFFATAAGAWSPVEAIRFGPVTEANRLERILFWPDRKSIGIKQVQAAIAEQDPSAADATSLTAKSVAMQGLGALEFVLFGTGSDDLLGPNGAYRCRYGQAIATNLGSMAADVTTAWNRSDGIAWQWANPGPDNPLYRNDAEAMTELFNVFVHGLEMIRDVRINGFLGKTAEDDKPRLAIYWRSSATVPSIASGLDGMRRMFDLADFATLLDEENTWIPGAISFEFANADKALKAADGPTADVLKDPARRVKLDYARIVTSSLSELFGVRLAGALGLSAGFSSLDGD